MAFPSVADKGVHRCGIAPLDVRPFLFWISIMNAWRERWMTSSPKSQQSRMYPNRAASCFAKGSRSALELRS